MRRRLLIALLLAAACSRASNEGEAKQWQEQPPPKEVGVPAGLSIGVTVNGGEHAPITSELLEKTKPDFVDTERRAWRIQTLVPDAAQGTTVEASSPTGVAVKFAQPTPEGLEPVLFLTRRGEVIVAALDPKDPFPRYHGQGARLHRPGDTMPRVAPVTKLAIARPTGAPSP
jgi:hypothetical protein